MDHALKSAINYFKLPHQYFWRWAEEGEVIEWRNGATISYRDDLASILEEIVPRGLPPIGTVLLLLSACQDKPIDDVEDMLIAVANRIPMKEGLRETISGFIVQAVEFMDIIHRLPKTLRTGSCRMHLLNELTTKIPNKIPYPRAQTIVDTLNSGQWDELLVKEQGAPRLKKFTTDLENLSHLYGFYKSKERLELVLKTGLDQWPPDIFVEQPEESPEGLLEQLADDPKTLGLSRLAKKLLAALNIPMQTQGASDLPYGGVSDITNRGDFDRLLLSELAQDQSILTARLVNNEALYLRREEPPQRLIQDRIILLDNTLKMWGLPRVFGLAVALACSQNNKQGTGVKAYTLGGQSVELMDLSSKKGVIHAMGHLDTHLHCGEALEMAMNQHDPKASNEFIFIIDEEAIDHPGIQLKLSEVKGALHYLILINRKGELQFFQHINGHRKLLSRSKFDLSTLVSSTQPNSIEVLNRPAGLPAATKREPFPLYFPAFRLNFRSQFTYLFPNERGALSVTQDQRVLLWEKASLGAREIISSIEYGEYFFGYDEPRLLYILVQQANVLQLYQIDLLEYQVIQKTITLDSVNRLYHCVFHSKHFFLYDFSGEFKINVQSGELIKTEFRYYDKQRLEEQHIKNYGHHAAQIKKMVNIGYSVLINIKRVYINESGRLAIDSREIKCSEKFICLHNYNKDGKAYDEPKLGAPVSLLPENPLIQFRKRKWENGSEAFLDSRGFLHLKSADRNLPEISMVLVLGKPLAFWASDGTYCGPNYFIGEGGQNRLPAPVFYKKYIQAFIDRID